MPSAPSLFAFTKLVPPLIYVSRKARAETLRQYKVFFSGSCEASTSVYDRPARIYVNPKLDAVLSDFGGYDPLLYKVRVMSVDVLNSVKQLVLNSKLPFPQIEHDSI